MCDNPSEVIQPNTCDWCNIVTDTLIFVPDYSDDNSGMCWLCKECYADNLMMANTLSDDDNAANEQDDYDDDIPLDFTEDVLSNNDHDTVDTLYED